MKIIYNKALFGLLIEINNVILLIIILLLILIPRPGLHTHSNGELEVNGSKFSHMAVPVSLQGSSLVKQAFSSRSQESPAKSAVQVQANEPFIVIRSKQLECYRQY